MRSGSILVLALLLAAVPAARADDEALTTLTLENGLTVLLRPIGGQDRVCVLVNFDVGGVHDPAGASGLTHIVEHLYFTCAAGDVPARTATEAMQAYPLGWQAQTSNDNTVIAAIVEGAALERELEVAAARMGDLKITQFDLDREIGRVADEVGVMFGADPRGAGIAALNHAREAVAPSPPGARRGGVPAHVRALTLEQVTAFWKRFLKPVNATLVVTGGFEREAAERIVRRCFTKLPRGEEPPARAPATPRTDAVITVDLAPYGPGATGHGVVTTAYATPDPGGALFVPFLVVTARLFGQRMKAGGKRQFPPPVYFALLDSPEAVYVTHYLGRDQEPGDVLAALAAAVEQAATGKPVPLDRMRVTNFFGFLLGIGFGGRVSPMSDPYGVAFGLARRRQLLLDPAAIEAALAKITQADLDRVRTEVFAPARRAAVVARPK